MKDFYKKINDGQLAISKQQAFTLIEMVTVIALVSIITVVVSVFFSQSLKSYRLKRQSVDLQEKAAHVMREFEQTTRAATSVTAASETELKFLRYFDLTSSSPDQVRYFLDGNEFKVGVTPPQGTPPNITYPQASENIELIIEDVVNTDLLFKFYNGQSEELNQPVDTANVRMVSLTISLDQDNSVPPGPIEETTKINLRNVKDNL